AKRADSQIKIRSKKSASRSDPLQLPRHLHQPHSNFLHLLHFPRVFELPVFVERFMRGGYAHLVGQNVTADVPKERPDGHEPADSAEATRRCAQKPGGLASKTHKGRLRV